VLRGRGLLGFRGPRQIDSTEPGMRLLGSFSVTDAPFSGAVRTLQNEILHVHPSTMKSILAVLGPQAGPSQITGGSPEVKELGFRNHLYELGDPRIIEVMQMVLKMEHMRPKPWGLTITECSERYYFQSLRREYSSRDLDKAPYLILRGYGNRWIAKMALREDFGNIKVVANKKLDDPMPYGDLYYPVYAMNTWLTEELERRKLKGFTVREIEIQDRRPGHQSIWQPWSTIMMPRCCLPVVSSWGEPCESFGIESTNHRGWHYECGPYQPDELVFLRAEVALLGDFDIAVCQEYLGAGYVRFPMIVVSQRFRQVLKELKVPGVAYAPVWLKEPGEPLWTNPWEEFLGPYPERVPLARSFEKA